MCRLGARITLVLIFRHSVVHFTLVCLVAELLNRIKAKVNLVMIQTLLLSNVNYFVIMLTRYWPVSKHGHLQLYSESKAWQPSTQLYDEPAY